MDRKTFLHYLEQPAALASLPQTELSALAEAYPHAANIRLLMALKARQENDPDASRLMERFSAATFDRPHLFDLLRQADRPKVGAAEILELRELDELELVPAGQAFDEIPSRLNEGQPSFAAPYASVPSVIPAVTKKPLDPAVAPKPEKEVPTEWADLAADFHAVVSTHPRQTAVPSGPEAPEKFAALLDRHDDQQALGNRLRSLRASVVGVQQKVGTARSAHPAVVSETLAELLCRQGQYGNAIRMYRRLMLLYPEKKPIFAGLIQELKQKL